MTGPSFTRRTLEASVKEARMIGRIGPTEALCLLKTDPFFGPRQRRIAPGVTPGGCRDAIETLQALHEANADKIVKSGMTSKLATEQATLCGAISILMRKFEEVGR